MKIADLRNFCLLVIRITSIINESMNYADIIGFM